MVVTVMAVAAITENQGCAIFSVFHASCLHHPIPSPFSCSLRAGLDHGNDCSFFDSC